VLETWVGKGVGKREGRFEDPGPEPAAESANSDNRIRVLGSTQFFWSSGRVLSLLDYPDKKKERKKKREEIDPEGERDDGADGGSMSWWYRAK